MDERGVADILERAIAHALTGDVPITVHTGPCMGRISIEMDVAGELTTFSWQHPNPDQAVLLPSIGRRLAARLASLRDLPISVDEMDRAENGPASWHLEVGHAVPDGILMLVQDRTPGSFHFSLTPKGAGWDASMKCDDRIVTAEPWAKAMLDSIPASTWFTCQRQNGRLHYCAAPVTSRRSRNEPLDPMEMMRAALLMQ